MIERHSPRFRRRINPRCCRTRHFFAFITLTPISSDADIMFIAIRFVARIYRSFAQYTYSAFNLPYAPFASFGVLDLPFYLSLFLRHVFALFAGIFSHFFKAFPTNRSIWFGTFTQTMRTYPVGFRPCTAFSNVFSVCFFFCGVFFIRCQCQTYSSPSIVSGISPNAPSNAKSTAAITIAIFVMPKVLVVSRSSGSPR